MADFLEDLLDDEALTRVIRFVLQHPGEDLTPGSIGEGTHLLPLVVARKMAFLTRIGLLKKKANPKCWQLNAELPYLTALRQFADSTAPGKREEVTRVLRKVGRLQSIIIGGVFVEDAENEIDLTLVGDKIDEKKLAAALSELEVLVGRELRYTVFSLQEFRYRRTVNDRLVRYVLERPHMVVLDTMGLMALGAKGYTPENISTLDEIVE